jgi:hypothetical protein
MSEPGYTRLASEGHDLTLSRRSSISTARNESQLPTRPPTDDAPASTPPSSSLPATPFLTTSHRVNLPPHHARGSWTFISDDVWTDVMVDTKPTRIRVSVVITRAELIVRE